MTAPPSLEQIAASAHPAWDKVDYFVSSFSEPLECTEWVVKWPIVHKNGVTYNPDFYCPALGYFIEVATSLNNVTTEWRKWQSAIDAGYALRVFWWAGDDITNNLQGATAFLRNKDRQP